MRNNVQFRITNLSVPRDKTGNILGTTITYMENSSIRGSDEGVFQHTRGFECHTTTTNTTTKQLQQITYIHA